MKEMKTIWTRRRLITAWEVDGQYEVTVFDADSMAYLEGFSRKFEEHEGAVDFATDIAHWFERITA